MALKSNWTYRGFALTGAYIRVDHMEVDLRSNYLRIDVSAYPNKEAVVVGEAPVRSESYLVRGTEFFQATGKTPPEGEDVKHSTLLACAYEYLKTQEDFKGAVDA